MAALDLHEQEQVDALKSWWKDNGKWLLVSLVVAVAAGIGVSQWKDSRARQHKDAAALYAEVEKQALTNDAKRVNDAAAALTARYGSSIYAALAELLAARVNLQAKDSVTAANQLQWVIDHAPEEGMQNLARLKLASVLVDEKKYDDALKLLGAPHSDAFDGLYDDMRGDVLTAQGKAGEARAAYKQALVKVGATSRYRAVIQAKLDALGAEK